MVPPLICHYFTFQVFSVKQWLYLLPLKISNGEHVNETWKWRQHVLYIILFCSYDLFWLLRSVESSWYFEVYTALHIKIPGHMFFYSAEWTSILGCFFHRHLTIDLITDGRISMTIDVGNHLPLHRWPSHVVLYNELPWRPPPTTIWTSVQILL